MGHNILEGHPISEVIRFPLLKAALKSLFAAEHVDPNKDRGRWRKNKENFRKLGKSSCGKRTFVECIRIQMSWASSLLFGWLACSNWEKFFNALPKPSELTHRPVGRKIHKIDRNFAWNLFSEGDSRIVGDMQRSWIGTWPIRVGVWRDLLACLYLVC